jgi:hypothetical protein
VGLEVSEWLGVGPEVRETLGGEVEGVGKVRNGWSVEVSEGLEMWPGGEGGTTSVAWRP